MPGRPHISARRGALLIAVLAISAVSVWTFKNRQALSEVFGGFTSTVANMNESSGGGAAGEQKNPILGTVPDFSLTAITGGTVEKTDLLGSFWVASFIFTRCATTCPMTVVALSGLQNDLPGEVKLVSISVDPEYDSPEVLAEYAEKIGADVDRWLFLTGDKDEIYRCIREGFRLAVHENPDGRPGWEVTHSPRLALVDPDGQIRGYYESSDEDDVTRLREDINRLVGRYHKSS